VINSLLQLSLNGIEAEINRILARDPDYLISLKTFNENVILIQITDLNLEITVQFQNNAIRLFAKSSEAPRATIQGRSMLLWLAWENIRKGKTILGSEIQVLGDTEFVQSFLVLLQSFEFDLEARLAYWTGDTIAHHTAKQLHKLNNWKNQVKTSMKQNATEYLQEETQILPCKEEVEDFLHAVDAMRLDVDRVESKITFLEKPHNDNK